MSAVEIGSGDRSTVCKPGRRSRLPTQHEAWESHKSVAGPFLIKDGQTRERYASVSETRASNMLW